jgi:hypothetical protein
MVCLVRHKGFNLFYGVKEGFGFGISEVLKPDTMSNSPNNLMIKSRLSGLKHFDHFKVRDFLTPLNLFSPSLTALKLLKPNRKKASLQPQNDQLGRAGVHKG